MGPSEPFEQILQRLEPLPGQFASAIPSWGPENTGPIGDMLSRIGRALGADRAVFESIPADSASPAEIHKWTDTTSTGGDERAFNTLVRLEGRPFGVLAMHVAGVLAEWPIDIKERVQVLANLIALAIQRGQHMRELERAKSEIARWSALPTEYCADLTDSGEPYDIIGDSPLLRVALGRVHEVAATDASVMLLGETGTGKELFARAVHHRSTRRDRPFVRVNCAALPQTLIESELFGHERGAFTGAVTTRQGRFELAHRGTIFLDEIGDLPAEVQSKLLRVLQEGEFERVGSSQVRKVDVRTVAATHHNLETAVSEGRFRADLYYRLNVYPISLPPLRDRLEDIPRLVWFFVNQRQRALGRKFTTIPPSVLGALQQYSWPGNVRELHNVIERAMIHSPGGTLRLDDGPPMANSLLFHEDGTLNAIERRHIEQALRRCQWRINGPGNAAEMLGLHPNTLRFRLKKLGIQRPTDQSRLRPLKRLSA